MPDALLSETEKRVRVPHPSAPFAEGWAAIPSAQQPTPAVILSAAERFAKRSFRGVEGPLASLLDRHNLP